MLLFGLSERTEAYHRGERLARARLRQSSALAPPPRARAGCSIANGDEPAADGDAEKDRARLELGRQKLEEIFAAKKETTGSSATALSVTERLLQQLFPSSQFVGGGDLPTKFLFVDELVCIGCTHCRYVAPKTFMLEEEFGRARVFKQGGDISDKIDEAIECCPVECIHQVSHTELVRLEEFRAAKGDALQGRFWKSRLVGSEIGARGAVVGVMGRGERAMRECPGGKGRTARARERGRGRGRGTSARARGARMLGPAETAHGSATAPRHTDTRSHRLPPCVAALRLRALVSPRATQRNATQRDATHAPQVSQRCPIGGSPCSTSRSPPGPA
jgi:ferredoxin